MANFDFHLNNLNNRSSNDNTKDKENRIAEIEKRLEELEGKLKILAENNTLLKKDLKFFELLLLEEYNLLLKLLGKDESSLFIHGLK